MIEEWSQFRMDASRHVSRAAGQSVVAAAAYRAGEKLEDARTGEIQDYTHRTGVVATEIVMPSHVGPSWTREQLWNAAEAAERRKDARVARKIELALPVQMTSPQRQVLAHAWAKEIANRYSVAVDYAIHLPDKAGDPRNHHVHMLVTTREISEVGLGKKAALELSNTDQKKRGLRVGNEGIYELREALAEVFNREAVACGLTLRADARSYAGRGIALTPTQHVGVHAVNMQRRGITSERMAILAQVKQENAQKIAAHPELILEKLTRTEAVFSRHDLARELNRYIDDPQEYPPLLARLEASPELVVLTPGEKHEPARYSTRNMIVAEARMVEVAKTLSAETHHAVSLIHRQTVMARFPYLSEEQREAVWHLTECGKIAVVAGAAGAGKSAALKAAGELWQAEGYRVRGAALAGKAAEGLQVSAGMESRTLHSLEYTWQKGRNLLTAQDVLVIDEAGMIGSRQLGRLLDEVHQARAKVVLVGDTRQLQPIEAGAAFRAVAEQVGVVEINTVRRQQEAWARQASQGFARGEVREGLAAYTERGHVQFLENRAAAKHAIARDWLTNGRREGACVILAHTNQDVRDLNEAVRIQRHRAGELGKEATFATAKGARQFAVGDRLVFLKNDREFGVKNGTLATVAQAEPGRLVAQLDSGQTVKFNQANYAHIDHGYAVTLHKAQGVTVARTYLLASGGMDRHLTYVGMTRHRETVTLYAGRDDFKDINALTARLSRARPKSTTLDFAQRRGFETQKAWLDNAKAWIERGRERLSELCQRVEQAIVAVRECFVRRASPRDLEKQRALRETFSRESLPPLAERREQLQKIFRGMPRDLAEKKGEGRRQALQSLFKPDGRTAPLPTHALHQNKRENVQTAPELSKRKIREDGRGR